MVLMAIVNSAAISSHPTKDFVEASDRQIGAGTWGDCAALALRERVHADRLALCQHRHM